MRKSWFRPLPGEIDTDVIAAYVETYEVKNKVILYVKMT